MFHLALLVMVELVLVLEQPNFPPRYLILAQSGMLVIFLSQCHHIASPITLYWSSYYPVGAAGDSSFSVSDGDGKGSVGTRTTHLSSQKFDCWIDGGKFVSYWISDYPSISHPNKDKPYY